MNFSSIGKWVPLKEIAGSEGLGSGGYLLIIKFLLACR